MKENMKQYGQNRNFLVRTYDRAFLPGVLSILSGNINILADGIIVGQKLGEDGLSAISLCLPIYLIICVFGSWIVSGTAINAGRTLGAGNQKDGDRFNHQALLLSLIASAVLTVLGFLFIDPTVSLLCPQEDIRPLVYDYTWANILGILPKILVYIPFWFLRLDGRNRSITVMMLIMGLGNALLDLLFMYGLDMGILGAGLASAAATALAAAYGFSVLYGRRKNFTPGLALPKGRKELLSVLSAGSPSALNNLLQSVRVLMINALLLDAGGSSMVALFTACNGVAAFSECILSGVPQAASAMLAGFTGDGDAESIRILMHHQIRRGSLLALAFSVVTVCGADPIAAAYGLDGSLRIPLLCLALSLFPALICTVMINYYNNAGMDRWADAMIAARVLLFPVPILALLISSGLSVWLFLTLGECASAAAWALLFPLLHGKEEGRSRYLGLEDEDGNDVISASVEGDSGKICGLSEGMLDFCTGNGMAPKTAMRISLAIEELLVLIAEENPGRTLFCDLRLKLRDAGASMVLRYGGKDFNPLALDDDDDMLYLGMKMLKGMALKTEYQCISGMNVLRITV